MTPNKILETLIVVYHDIELALWALLLTSLIFFLVFVVPKLPEIRARMEGIRAEEITAENAFYCEKLQLQRGTQKYNQCLLILGEFRLKVEKRIAAENDF